MLRIEDSQGLIEVRFTGSNAREAMIQALEMLPEWTNQSSAK